MANGKGRTRNFACIVYPDDVRFNSKCPNYCGYDSVLSALSDLKINALVSPLHKDDKNATGEDKPPHYHVIIAFDSVKTLEQAEEIGKKICAKNNVMHKVESFRNYARYLCHLDNPEKAQYSIDDVKVFGDLDYIGIIQSASSKYNEIGAMMDFCRMNQVYQFYALLDYARQYMFDSWFRLLCDNSAYIMKEYCKSLYWDAEENKNHEKKE